MTSPKQRIKYLARAKRIYENELRDDLVKDHVGYIVKVDGRSGKFAIGISASQTLAELKEKCHAPVTYTARIGSDHVYDLPSSTSSGHLP